MMSGSSGSGKITRVFQFLKLKDVLNNAEFYKNPLVLFDMAKMYNKMKTQMPVNHLIEWLID